MALHLRAFAIIGPAVEFLLQAFVGRWGFLSHSCIPRSSSFEGCELEAKGPCSLRNLMQLFKKSGVRNSRGIGAENRRLTFGSQCRHSERHGDSVIAEGIQFRAVQMLA